VLTDKEIEDIALEYTRLCGGHWDHKEAIPDGDILEFARAIEKAVLFDELQTWTTSRWWALQTTKDERCGKCGRMFWHHIKAKMHLEA
jgi:phosphoribosylaminoimidazole-succinocarboxamide synthase